MFRFLSISIMAVGLASASAIYTTTDLATAQGSITIGSTPPTITGTGSSTFVNNSFSSTMSTATAPAASSTPQEFTNNAGVSTVPFVVDQDGSGDAQYVSNNVTNTTTTLVIDMGGYTGGAANTGIFSVNLLYTLLQGF